MSGGEVKILRDVETDLAGREVLIVDDILDSGRTLAYAKTILEEHGALRVLQGLLGVHVAGDEGEAAESEAREDDADQRAPDEQRIAEHRRQQAAAEDFQRHDDGAADEGGRKKFRAREVRVRVISAHVRSGRSEERWIMRINEAPSF